MELVTSTESPPLIGVTITFSPAASVSTPWGWVTTIDPPLTTVAPMRWAWLRAVMEPMFSTGPERWVNRPSSAGFMKSSSSIRPATAKRPATATFAPVPKKTPLGLTM